MNYYNLEISISTDNIKMYKNAIKLYRGIFYFTLIFISSQIYSAFHNPNFVVCVFIGAFITNLLWLSGDLYLLKSDLKLEKERFNHLKDIRDNRITRGMDEQCTSAKEIYDRLCGELANEIDKFKKMQTQSIHP